MRTLKFIVDDQIIRKDPNCDFSGLVPGTQEYLDAEFSFSQAWDNTVRVVAFWRNGKECEPQFLKDGKRCTIPAEALTSTAFKLAVVGRKKDFKLTTNKVEILQNGGV